MSVELSPYCFSQCYLIFGDPGGLLWPQLQPDMLEPLNRRMLFPHCEISQPELQYYSGSKVFIPRSNGFAVEQKFDCALLCKPVFYLGKIYECFGEHLDIISNIPSFITLIFLGILLGGPDLGITVQSNVRGLLYPCYLSFKWETFYLRGAIFSLHISCFWQGCSSSYRYHSWLPLEVLNTENVMETYNFLFKI